MQEEDENTGTGRLETLVSFADEILNRGRDGYGNTSTPLFVDGLEWDTYRPLNRGGEEGEVSSNLACQQNLFRFLDGLTALTGRERFRRAACDALEYHFHNLQSPCGLLAWGGHRHLDLCRIDVAGSKALSHELKFHIPYYELMWDVDAGATRRYIRAFWNAHILDWGKLDMNRHGKYGRTMGDLWGHAYEPADPFFEGQGLTFINCGTDLIYAAILLYLLDGDSGALEWGKRLAHQYVRARHPKTGLGVYQYSQPKRRKEPPADPGAPDYTYSSYGDRLKRQFGPEFGDIALEGNFLDPSRGHSIYGRNALVQLQLAGMLGREGEDLLRWTVDGMVSYIDHAYLPAVNRLQPLWTDGTDLSYYPIKRYGYRGRSGQVIEPGGAGGMLFLSAATGYRLSGEDKLWVLIRNAGRGLSLGDIGTARGRERDPNFETHGSDPLVLLGLLELDEALEDDLYLRLADRIGDNILRETIAPATRKQKMVFSQPQPLALLRLEAARAGTNEAIPRYRGGK